MEQEPIQIDENNSNQPLRSSLDQPITGQHIPDPVQIESSCSTLIKLEEDNSEGESLDSKVLQAIVQQVVAKEQSMHRRNSTGFSKCSQQLAESLLRNKSMKDSTEILAREIEKLRDMEHENENMAS